MAIVLAQGGYFWLTGAWQWAAYAGAVVLVVTAGARFCPLYRLLGVGTAQFAGGKVSPIWRGLGWLALLALLVGGSYGSAFFSRKLFLEEFNAMNHFYKADSSTRCNKDEPGDGWLRMSRHHGHSNRQVQVARCTSTSAEKNDTKFTAS